MGPTGSGKSELAEHLAEQSNSLLISADAFQVYRGLDIGTNKPANRSHYKLLDLVDPDESFGLGEWIRLAQNELWSAWGRRQSAIVVGGTGLYIRALFEEFADMSGLPDPGVRAELTEQLAVHGLESLVRDLEDKAPEIAAKIDLRNPVRVRRALEKLIDPGPRLSFPLPPYQKQKVAIQTSRPQLWQNIATRTDRMVQNGWIDEVKGLREKGFDKSGPGFRAIGYRDIWRHLEGEVSQEQAIDHIVIETRQYAKRQISWLKSEPNLCWLTRGRAEESGLPPAFLRSQYGDALRHHPLV
jgi:tRNA dimethylallyltransferase